MVVVLVIAVQFSWNIAKWLLLTEYPLVYVASNSMYPTLRIGDLLFVKGVDPEDIREGDIIVFRKTTGSDERIVHRVVRVKSVGGRILITTKGDNNLSPMYWERDFDSSYVIGKVFFWMRFIGFIPMILQEPNVKWGLTAVLVMLLVYDFLLEASEKKSRDAGKE